MEQKPNSTTKSVNTFYKKISSVSHAEVCGAPYGMYCRELCFTHHTS